VAGIAGLLGLIFPTTSLEFGFFGSLGAARAGGPGT